MVSYLEYKMTLIYFRFLMIKLYFDNICGIRQSNSFVKQLLFSWVKTFLDDPFRKKIQLKVIHGKNYT